MANKGIINIFTNGKQEEYYPKTIYETVFQDATSQVNLKDDIDSLKTFQTSAGTKLDGIEEGANNYVHPSTSGNKHIPAGGKTGQILKWSAAGTAVWGEDQNTTYSVATGSVDGLMSATDKSKLDGIQPGANNYIHPTGDGHNHIPEGGTTGQVLRWSEAGVAVWGADNDTKYDIASTTANGLMSSAMVTKLASIAEGANKYVHPDNANTRHVTDVEKAKWDAKESTTGSQAKADAALASAKSYTDTKVADIVDSAPEALNTLKELSTALGNDPNFATTIAGQIGSKVDKVTGKGLSTNDYTTAEKTKLAGIAEGANKYVHPTTTGNKHIPSGGAAGQILRYSASGTAVWGEEKDTTYGIVSKQDAGLVPQLPDETTTTKYLRQDGTWVTPPNTTYGVASTTANGLMSSTMVTKLAGIAEGANKYVHPTTEGNKHIPAGGSTGQILRYSAAGTAVWGEEKTYSVASTTANGLMSSADKAKLDGIATGANKYVHPTGAGNNHIPSGGVAGQFLKWSASGVAVWANDNNTTYSVATQSANGLMSAADKKKLDGIATGANNYTHPSSHPATIITQDATHRFVSDTEKSTWNGKANASHGNHVPSKETANNARFLRNDNTWQNVTADNVGAARGGRTIADVTTAGWYRIAQSVKRITNVHGRFLIRSTASGYHSTTELTAATQYGQGVVLYQEAHSAYWSTGLSKARIVYHGTYEDNYAYLEVYIPNAISTTLEVLMVGATGWSLVTPSTAGSIPSGYSNKEITLASNRKIVDINGTVNGYSISKSVPSNAVFTDTVYKHPTGAGNNHIPSGGAAGQFLKWSSSGVAVWANDNNTTYGVATTTANGLMSATDKKSFDVMKTENSQLKQILVLIANMNGCNLPTSATMSDILAAFTELQGLAENMQFVYGSIEPPTQG